MFKKPYLEGYTWLTLSILLGIKSITLDLGNFSSPGPGFTPFVMAVFMFVLSLILLVQTYHAEKSLAQGLNFRSNSLFVIFSMVVYVFVINKIGYILSSFVLWTLIFRAMGTKKWKWSLIEGILVTFLSYLIFGVVLKLNLPIGFFFF